MELGGCPSSQNTTGDNGRQNCNFSKGINSQTARKPIIFLKIKKMGKGKR
jgi:hypothetical protein